MKGIIIMGSSRSDGDTAQAVNVLSSLSGYEVLDLKSLKFSDYDYHSNNLKDDFLPTIHSIVSQYDQIVLATPVYWYTMSALMKRFLDRISDCLRVEKDTGRKFRGKNLAMISVSNDKRPPHYAEPFILSAAYLGMNYLGDQHIIFDKDNLCSLNPQLLRMVGLLKSQY
ncbi:MAG: flavodoxin family protein [Xanthomonadales bacterium]|nr:flavodoxin family protein [Xanthomonadales bacterium]